MPYRGGWSREQLILLNVSIRHHPLSLSLSLNFPAISPFVHPFPEGCHCTGRSSCFSLKLFSQLPQWSGLHICESASFDLQCKEKDIKPKENYINIDTMNDKNDEKQLPPYSRCMIKTLVNLSHPCWLYSCFPSPDLFLLSRYPTHPDSLAEVSLNNFPLSGTKGFSLSLS